MFLVRERWVLAATARLQQDRELTYQH